MYKYWSNTKIMAVTSPKILTVKLLILFEPNITYLNAGIKNYSNTESKTVPGARIKA